MTKALLLLTLLSSPFFAAGETAFEEIKIPGDKNYSYVLYLPSSYDAKRPAPILYAYDARGRGKIPAELFREGAERFGYIIASSNDTRSDDPGWPNWEIMEAMWKDTHSRFVIDPKRVYMTGFSGGARSAWGLAYVLKGQVTGVIGCGAGAHPEKLPAADMPFIFYGIVGQTDFNYDELQSLDRKLDEAGIIHRVESFEGGHDWPPAESATRAIEWMEIQAMRAGTRSKDESLAIELYRKQLEQASHEEKSGNVWEAHRLYRAALNDFKGLINVSEAEQKTAAIEKMDAYKDFLKAEEKRQKRQAEYMARLRKVVQEAFAPSDEPILASKLIQELNIRNLKKQSEDTSEDALAARRLLENVFVQLSFYIPQELMKRQQYRKAIIALTVSSEIKPENPFVYYNLAASYSRMGEKKKALENLRTSIQKGFKNKTLLQQDEDFKNLQDDAEFQQIVQLLSQS